MPLFIAFRWWACKSCPSLRSSVSGKFPNTSINAARL
nr:MAG TPA: hypothetical protein [Caudoviricetes sp.]